MKRLLLTAAAVLATASAAPAMASTVNLGFASGDLSGWTIAGSGSVTPQTDALDALQNSYARTEAGRVGETFAQLIAGPDDQYTTLSRQFQVFGTGVLSLEAAFLAFDTADFNDDGFVRLHNDDTDVTTEIFTASNVSVGDNASTGWVAFTAANHNAFNLAAGHYTLLAGVENVGDDLDNFFPGFDGELLLDNVTLSDTGQVGAGGVPEPASWALMITGFAGLGAALRGRRASLTAA
jgi:hypothetical protein